MCENTISSATGISNNTAKIKNQSDLITPDELASQLGVGLPFIRKLAYKRALPVVKVGRYVRFKRSDVDTWLEQNTRPARAGA
jgi:excisionase family DNA binding protein